MITKMWTNLNNPARALQILCKQAAVLEMLSHRPDGLVHNQTAAINETVRILRTLTAMLSQDCYLQNSKRDEVTLLNGMRRDLKQKWLTSPALSEEAKLVVHDLVRQLDALDVTLRGGFSQRMFPMLQGNDKQSKAQKFSDFQGFYLNMTCENCPTTNRGLALVYEDIHVPDLIKVTGGDHVWGQFVFKCPAKADHKVHPSMHVGKGRTNKPKSLIMGKPLIEHTNGK